MIWACFWFFSPIALAILTTSFNLQRLRLEEKSHHKYTWSLDSLLHPEFRLSLALHVEKEDEEKKIYF